MTPSTLTPANPEQRMPEQTGRQRDELDLYLRIVEGVREHSEVSVVPTGPFLSDGDLTRYSASEKLAHRGLIEWAAIDPGSCQIARADDIEARRAGFVNRNGEGSVHAACGWRSAMPSQRPTRAMSRVSGTRVATFAEARKLGRASGAFAEHVPAEAA